ncbi:MAG: DNA translocase FtsK [bacterium]|nr:DNA translocase FtsK [bacterium]
MAKLIKKIKTKTGLGEKLRRLRSQIHPETEQSVLGIIFIGVATILILANFHKAGPAGELTYKILSQLFGLGYYLFPTIFLVMAGTFLSGQEKKERAMTVTFLSAVFFVAAGLGLIDIIFPDKGGMVGRWIGTLEIPFGYTAAIIVDATILLAALILTANVPLKIRRLLKEEKKPEAPLVVKNADSFTAPAAASKAEESKQVPEKETNAAPTLAESEAGGPNTAYVGQNPKAFFVPRKKASGALPISKNYTPPPTSLLKSSIEKPTSGDLRANANIIKRTLESFGIPVEMGEITIGPKVTRYTLKPAEGIKLTRIIALNQDLSLALAAHPIRIEAPIPGKSLVGIEVPNKSAAIVRLGSLMAFPEFTGSGPLGFILGRDVSGDPIIADIEKMPHLLIAGSTGSGKSVAIHSLIISLLYKNSPETLRMILIDPKRVELTIYNDIPHLIAPVITEGKKALGVFRWAIEEMEKRYEKLQGAGARDIRSYNKTNPKDTLPYLVIVVDELADLMAAYGRDIESSIVRLAQMARATGIHLVLSTQRPSVEVITGLIKANITARMALQVASQVDSRTILDMAGAEKLLGGGDMLFTSSDLSKPKRIQGAYISEEEMHAVADFIRDHNPSLLEDQEPTALEKSLNQSSKSEGLDFDNYAQVDDDELYDEAVQIVREAQKASASLLQRRLAVGYARAARLLDIMEERGVVGPGDGAKPREVYLDRGEQN